MLQDAAFQAIRSTTYIFSTPNPTFISSCFRYPFFPWVSSWDRRFIFQKGHNQEVGFHE